MQRRNDIVLQFEQTEYILRKEYGIRFLHRLGIEITKMVTISWNDLQRGTESAETWGRNLQGGSRGKNTGGRGR